MRCGNFIACTIQKVPRSIYWEGKRKLAVFINTQQYGEMLQQLCGHNMYPRSVTGDFTIHHINVHSYAANPAESVAYGTQWLDLSVRAIIPSFWLPERYLRDANSHWIRLSAACLSGRSICSMYFCLVTVRGKYVCV